MPLRKYQATSSRDANVYHTGDGFVFVRGGEAGPPIWPPPNPPPPPPPPECTGGRVWNGSACECPHGLIWNGSACVEPCGPNSHWDPIFGSCVCDEGYHLEGGSCVPDSPPPPPCPPDGTIISGPFWVQDLTYDAGCGSWTIGSQSQATVADGNCGTREETYNNYNVGTIGTCYGNVYSVDSSGNVTSVPE